MYDEMQMRPCGGGWAYCDGRCERCACMTVTSTTSSSQTKQGKNAAPWLESLEENCLAAGTNTNFPQK